MSPAGLSPPRGGGGGDDQLDTQVYICRQLLSVSPTGHCTLLLIGVLAKHLSKLSIMPFSLSG